MWSTSRRRCRQAGLLLGLALLGLLLPGCATTGHDSEMPWSTPESWEGTVPLPPSMQRE